MNAPEWLKPGNHGAEVPDRDMTQACLASLEVDASPERPEAAADEG